MNHGLLIDDIKELDIPLPSKEEQKGIIQLLDQAENLLQMRIIANQKMSELLSSLMNSMFGDLINEQNDYQSVPLKSLVTISSLRKQPISCEYGKECLVVTPQSLYEGTINKELLDYAELENSFYYEWRLEAGDTLLSMNSTKGANYSTAIYTGKIQDVVLGSEVLLLRPRMDKINPHFLHALMNTTTIRSIIKHRSNSFLGIYTLNSTEIGLIELKLPPIEQQSKFSELAKNIQNYKELQTESYNNINNLNKIMIYQAFSKELTFHSKNKQKHFVDQERHNALKDQRIVFPNNPLLIEQKAIVLAYIVFATNNAKRMIASVKLAKQYYLISQLMKEPPNNFFTPNSAGPLESHFYDAIKYAQNKQWITVEPKTGNEKPFSIGPNIAEADNQFNALFGEDRPKIEKFLNLSKNWSWQTLERWATVHFIALKLIELNKSCNAKSISESMQEDMFGWQKKVTRDEFSLEKINSALNGLKRYGFFKNQCRRMYDQEL
jgi:hypothetical protein